MLVGPPQTVQSSLSNQIALSRGKVSCLDRPRFAAVHLKTKEDLALFYGDSHALISVPVALQLLIWAMTAIALGIGGNNQGSRELDRPISGEVFEMDVEALLAERQALIG